MNYKPGVPYCTNDYGIFEDHKGNRAGDELNGLAARSLRDSMSQEGFWKSHAITCRYNGGGKLKILFGHRRKAVAESLGIPIYFVVETDERNFVREAMSVKPWKLDDYALCHATNGKEDYVEAIEFANKYDMTFGNAFALLHGTVSHSKSSPKVKDGTFEIKDREWATQVAEFYHSMMDLTGRKLAKSPLIEACARLLRVPSFNPDRMIKGVARKVRLLVSCSKYDDYLKLFEELYNYGSLEFVALRHEASKVMLERKVTAACKVSASNNAKRRKTVAA
jgi:hypothetical protein